jgi:glycosyltransferase involved in cell wall biosynthesis
MKKLRSLPLSQNSVVVSIETLINFATFFALKTKARLIATEHTSFERSFITQFLKKFIYPKFDQLVVLTQEDARKYRKFCANVTVIPNFVPIPQKRSISKKRILFVGNIEPVKGVEFLEQIIKNFPLKEWEFCIVGNGSKLQWLQDHLRGYNVRFAGALSDVVPYYLKSAIFILTSKKEGFPMVLLEAKSFGLPIVSFDIPTGPKEIVRNGVDGFLVPLGDIQGFVRRLEILAQDDTLREAFSQAAREDIERFSPEKIGALWQKILF